MARSAQPLVLLCLVQLVNELRINDLQKRIPKTKEFEIVCVQTRKPNPVTLNSTYKCMETYDVRPNKTTRKNPK